MSRAIQPNCLRNPDPEALRLSQLLDERLKAKAVGA